MAFARPRCFARASSELPHGCRREQRCANVADFWRALGIDARFYLATADRYERDFVLLPGIQGERALLDIEFDVPLPEREPELDLLELRAVHLRHCSPCAPVRRGTARLPLH